MRAFDGWVQSMRDLAKTRGHNQQFQEDGVANSFDQKYAELQKSEREGDYASADRAYGEILTYLQALPSNAHTWQVLRSLAFNYAIFLNKHFKNYQKALEMVALGMRYEPTEVGISVAEAARGEALWGLGNRKESMAAFKSSIQAHPISGRLDTAESLVRIGEPALLEEARQMLDTVETKYNASLTGHWKASLQATRQALAQKTGQKPKESFWSKLWGK
jgi:tetratricopeptide (TPR) repeat protein